MRGAIAWGITGSGVFLAESIDAIKILIENQYRVTAFISRAGESVLRMYGLKDKIESLLTGDYPTGVIYESEQSPGYHVTGRLYLGVYSAVVISPATMNTVSKIVYGIADSLISNLAMHSLKALTPLFILPVDAIESRSKVPIIIDRSKCIYCSSCSAAKSCPHNALVENTYYKVVVKPENCTRCYLCIPKCPYNAIIFDKEIVVKPHPHYLAIIEKLMSIRGIHVVTSIYDILAKLGVIS